MSISPLSVEAYAAEQIRAGLSRSTTLQDIFAVSGADAAAKAAALLPLIYIVDAEDTEAAPLQAPYVLLVVLPSSAEELTDDLTVYSLDVAIEVWIPTPAASANAGDDFMQGLNIAQVLADIRADEATINFELGASSASPPVRDDETAGPDTAGDIGYMMQLSLEAWGD